MPRPPKHRRVGFVPGNRFFWPDRFGACFFEEVLLTVEEVEALRLSDLEGLEQNEAASLMEISRGTFQRILKEARNKIADAIVNGLPVRIHGGHFKERVCMFECKKCGHKWKDTYGNVFGKDNGECPECQSNDIKYEKKSDRKWLGKPNGCPEGRMFPPPPPPLHWNERDFMHKRHMDFHYKRHKEDHDIKRPQNEKEFLNLRKNFLEKRLKYLNERLSKIDEEEKTDKE